MRFYALSGRQGDALAQYERLKEALSGWLGTDPRPTTRALRQDIAAGRFALTSQQLPRRRHHRTLASTTCPRPRQPSSGAGEKVEIKDACDDEPLDPHGYWRLWQDEARPGGG